MIWKIQKKKNEGNFFFRLTIRDQERAASGKVYPNSETKLGKSRHGPRTSQTKHRQQFRVPSTARVDIRLFPSGIGCLEKHNFHSFLLLPKSFLFFFNLLIFSCLFFFPSTSSSSYFRFLLITVTGYCLFTQI